MAKVVYTDWRDRQFEPEIIGVYEDEFMAYGDREEKERELASQGYDSEEVTVWIEDVDIKKSDMAEMPENVAVAELEELLQHNSAVKLAISDCGNGIAEIIAVDTFRKVVVVKWVTFTTCYDCQSYEENIFSKLSEIRMDEIAMEYEGVGEEIGDRQLRFCAEAVKLTKEEMIEMRKESIAYLNVEKEMKQQ